MGSGVSFGSIHSERDLDLILTPFSGAPAIPKTNFVNVPGADGVLDYTEALGKVFYNARELNFVFAISPLSTMTYDEKLTQVSNLINGRKFEIILDRDPDYYWEGRCEVVDYLKDKALKQITIKATVQPYKLKRVLTTYKYILINGSVEVVLKNSKKPVTPIVTCSKDGMTIKFKGNIYSVPEGTYRMLDLQLDEGDNNIIIEGTGTIEIEYREGAL